jgi:protein-tyrosine phosphatase
VWQIDDGARTADEGIEMLQRLAEIGFGHVVATPHMRPGMFDNLDRDLSKAYLQTLGTLEGQANLPATSLGSEHFFDSEVIGRIRSGQGLPYREMFSPDEGARRGGAILIEFADLSPLSVIERQLFELQTEGYIPVIAHPERYRTCWKSPETVQRLVDLGSVALLDIAALVGKYGRRSKAAAWELLEMGTYDAACTDSHRPSDVELADQGIGELRGKYGDEEVEFLFRHGPRALLEGGRPPVS